MKKKFGKYRRLLSVLALVLSLVLILNVSKPAGAANPATINFQGKVVNADGTNVANNTYSIVFRIYNTSSPTMTSSCTSTASCLWEETQASVSVNNGVLQVELGASCALTSSSCNNSTGGPIPSTWSSSSLYLTLQFAGDTSGTRGGFMFPLMHMTSVPFAFNADNLGGIAASGYVQLQGSTPGTQQTGNLNVSGTGIFGTALQTPLLQTASAVDLQVKPATGIVKINTASVDNEVRVFENNASPTNYTSIKYGNISTNSGNLTVAAAGTTTIGNGTGAITINAGSGSAVNITGHAASTWQTDTASSLLIQGGSTLQLLSTSTSAITLDSGSSGNVNVGTGATGKAVAVGNTQSGTTVTQTAGALTNTLSNTSNIIKTNTNSATAFQLQNAGGSVILNVDTTDTNLLATLNPGFEASTTSPWAVLTGASVAKSTSQYNQGFASGQITAGTTSPGAGVGGISNAITLSNNTNYTLSFYAKLDSTSAALTTLQAGYSSTGAAGGEIDCNLNSNTVVSTGWNRYYCTFTTPSSNSGTPYIYLQHNDSTSEVFYVDGVQIEAATSATAYGAGAIRFNANITSPVSIVNTFNSSTAFSVQNVANVSLLNIDTQNSGITFNDPNNRAAINFNLASATNVITNTSFENGNANTAPPGWAADIGNGGSLTTFATDNSVVAHDGAENFKVTTNGVNTGQGAKFTFSGAKLTANTTYVFSVWASSTDASWSTFDLGRNINAAGDTTCLAGQTLATGTPMQQFSCTFSTLGTTTTSDYVFVRNSAAAAHTFFIDSVSLQAVNDGFINVVTNPSFETGSTNGWFARGTATLTTSTDAANFGTKSLKVATGTVAGFGAGYQLPFLPSSQYSLSFWARRDTSSAATFNIGVATNTNTTGTVTQSTNTLTGTSTTFTSAMVGDQITYTSSTFAGTTDTITGFTSGTSVTVSGSRTNASAANFEVMTDSDCLTAQTIDTTWRQFTCTFNVGSTVGSHPSFYIRQTDTTTDNIYLDGVTLVQASSGLSFSQPAQNIQVDAQQDNITLNSGNAGEIQPWQLGANAVTARRHGSSAIANGYMYYIGGLNSTPAPVTTVNYAKLNADGSVGTWNTTTALPVALYGHASVVTNGYLYVIGGCSDSSSTAACSAQASTIYYASIKPDGTLGSWQTSVYILGSGGSCGASGSGGYVAVTVVGNYMYRLGGGNNGSTLSCSAKLSADGSTSGWSTASSLATGRYGATAISANGYLYVIGGCSDAGGLCNTALASIEYVQPNGSGGITGSWSTTTQLPRATGLHNAMLLNGYIYVLGGRSAGAPVNSVMYARVNSDNTLGAWNNSVYSLPAARQGASSLANNSYIYTVGGYDGTSVQGTVFQSSGARTLVFGGLDLLGLTGQTASDPDGAGSLTAGDTKIIGQLRVDDLATLNNGLVVNGPISIQSPGTGGSIISINNVTTGINLFSLRDLSTNFGGAATSGAFISRNSYFGEEFAVGNGATPATGQTCTGNVTATEIGWDRGDFGSHLAPAVACGTSASPGSGEFNFSSKLGATTASDQCQALSPAVTQVNGAERLLAQSTTTAANSAVCVEALSAGQAVSNKIYAAANLPVITMKVKMSTLTNDTNARVYLGMSASDTATGAGVGMPGNGIFFSNCSGYSQTAPTGCSNTTWYGYASTGNAAVAGTPVTCSTGSGSLTAQFSYLRIEVRATNDIHFFADYSTADGIQENECGTGSTAAASGSAMAPWIQTTVASNVAATSAVDVDYFRSWQDDNIPSAATDPENPTTDTTPSGQSLISTPPIDPDSSDPEVTGSFFNFMGNTADDTVFNHNVFVHGTLYADKIKANQIEGLQVFTNELGSLQQQLATEKSSNPSDTNSIQAVSQPLSLNIKDALTVGGPAEFRGNALFYKLVSFMEKAVFHNDVTFAAHITTSGSAPTTDLGAAAGVTLSTDGSVNLASATITGNDNSGQLAINIGDGSTSGGLLSVIFKRPFDNAPRIFITPSNEAAAQARYYVTSTSAGFKLVASTPPPTPGTSLIFNYWVVQ